MIGHQNKENVTSEMIDSLLDFLIYILNDDNQREFDPFSQLKNLNTKM